MISDSPVMPLCISTKQAAKILGVSTSTVSLLRRSGKIECIRLGAGKKNRVVFSMDGLKRFVAENSKAVK